MMKISSLNFTLDGYITTTFSSNTIQVVSYLENKYIFDAVTYYACCVAKYVSCVCEMIHFPNS